MHNFKKSRQSFSLVELTIYIALFGVLTFALFNIFGSILNFGNLAKQQNDDIPTYVSNPIRIDIPFTTPLPSDLNPLPKPVIPLPPGKPVVPIPDPENPNFQYCQTQLMVQKCGPASEGCYVCKCDETACSGVTGCAQCHNAFIEDPRNSAACECEDIKTALDNNSTLPLLYSYDIFNPNKINIVPLANDD